MHRQWHGQGHAEEELAVGSDDDPFALVLKDGKDVLMDKS